MYGKVLLADIKEPSYGLLDLIEDTVTADHDKIVRLEQDINDLHDLFKDLSILVNDQQEQLNSIETHIEIAKDHARKGEISIQNAEKTHKKTRNITCCVIVSAMCILLVIGLIVGFLIKY